MFWYFSFSLQIVEFCALFVLAFKLFDIIVIVSSSIKKQLFLEIMKIILNKRKIKIKEYENADTVSIGDYKIIGTDWYRSKYKKT